MQKLVFYVQKRLAENRVRAMNYSFIKLLFPTFSTELRSDLNDLTRLGFLEGQYYEENDKARMIIEDFHQVFDGNLEIKRLIDEEVDRYAPIETDDLVKITRQLRWGRKAISELINGTPLVYPPKTRIRRTLKISDEDLEDLAICLSPKVAGDMEQAFDELRRGKRLTHAEVFG